MKNVTAQVAAGLEGIKVYPTIGNHDTYPQDDIKMSSPKSNPAINEWAPSWNQFITDKDQIDNWLNWGYYVLPLETANGTALGSKKTKIISLNSNICYSLNFDAMAQFSDGGN